MPESPFIFGFDHAENADKSSDKQKWFFKRHIEAILDILTPEERTNAQIMGMESWLASLNKHEASRIIGRVKDEAVGRDVIRRSQGPQEPPPAVEPPKKWFNTGLNG